MIFRYLFNFNANLLTVSLGAALLSCTGSIVQERDEISLPSEDSSENGLGGKKEKVSVPPIVTGAQLVADYSSARWRCGVTNKENATYLVSCQLNVVLPSGSEVRASQKSPSLGIVHRNPVIVEGSLVTEPSCEESNDGMTRVCTATATSASVKIKFEVELSDKVENLSRVEQDTVLLPYFVGVSAGRDFTVPYIFSATSGVRGQDKLEFGFKVREFDSKNFDVKALDRFCFMGKDLYFSSRGFIYKYSDGTITLFAGGRGSVNASSPTAKVHRLRQRFRFNLDIACSSNGYLAVKEGGSFFGGDPMKSAFIWLIKPDGYVSLVAGGGSQSFSLGSQARSVDLTAAELRGTSYGYSFARSPFTKFLAVSDEGEVYLNYVDAYSYQYIVKVGSDGLLTKVIERSDINGMVLRDNVLYFSESYTFVNETGVRELRSRVAKVDVVTGVVTPLLGKGPDQTMSEDPALNLTLIGRYYLHNVSASEEMFLTYLSGSAPPQGFKFTKDKKLVSVFDLPSLKTLTKEQSSTYYVMSTDEEIKNLYYLSNSSNVALQPNSFGINRVSLSSSLPETIVSSFSRAVGKDARGHPQDRIYSGKALNNNFSGGGLAIHPNGEVYFATGLTIHKIDRNGNYVHVAGLGSTDTLPDSAFNEFGTVPLPLESSNPRSLYFRGISALNFDDAGNLYFTTTHGIRIIDSTGYMRTIPLDPVEMWYSSSSNSTQTFSTIGGAVTGLFPHSDGYVYWTTTKKLYRAKVGHPIELLYEFSNESVTQFRKVLTVRDDKIVVKLGYALISFDLKTLEKGRPFASYNVMSGDVNVSIWQNTDQIYIANVHSMSQNGKAYTVTSKTGVGAIIGEIDILGNDGLNYKDFYSSQSNGTDCGLGSTNGYASRENIGEKVSLSLGQVCAGDGFTSVVTRDSCQDKDPAKRLFHLAFVAVYNQTAALIQSVKPCDE